MLVLTRRIGEQIIIDNGQIEVKMLYVRNGSIAVGIKAPSHINVDRKEIFMLKQAAKKEAKNHQMDVANV